MIFRRLSTRLIVLFGGLFAVSLIFLLGAAQLAVRDYARANTQAEMNAVRTVFQRLWDQKTDSVRTNAELLARDFGFATALVSGDLPTLQSAFDNLMGRVGAEDGLVLSGDGTVLIGADVAIAADMTDLVMEDFPGSARSGVIVASGIAYSVTVAPVLAPDPIGWVVFAARIDRAQMDELQGFASVPLNADIVAAQPSPAAPVRWSVVSGSAQGDHADLSNFDVAPGDSQSQARLMNSRHGDLIVVSQALKGLRDTEAETTRLVLSYPMDKALAAYGRLFAILAVLGVVTLVGVIAACLGLARKITRPVIALRQAAQRLSEGQNAQVEVVSRDEIGDLAHSFNAMSQSLSEREQRITHLARHDLVTNLLNRSAFEAYVEGVLASGRKPVVLAVAVERFARIRSVWGAAFSDRLIATMGQLICDLNPQATVARLNTHVLGVTLAIGEGEDQGEVARLHASLFADVLNTRLSIDDQVVDVHTLIGFEAAPEPQFAARDYVERALVAVDQADAGRNRIAEFDSAAFSELADNVRLTEELHSALDREELMAFYQPKLDLRTGRISAAEALVRWNHRERGMVSPQRFVLLAEETGYIRDLTLLVLRMTLRDQARLQEDGFDIKMSVNFSGRLLTDLDYVRRTIELCRGVEDRVCLEITETAVIEDPRIGLMAVEAFVAAGIEVSIDDFGTGLSSLSYLKMIPAQELKIDRSFVMDMHKSQRERLLVASTINLAHGLGMKVTAEGVEDPMAIAMLTAMGCDMAQGYAIAKPLPGEAFLDFLRTWNGLEMPKAVRPRQRKRAS